MECHPFRQRAACTTLGLSCCLLVMACSPIARYEVLSFFFDGVPPPQGVELPPGMRPRGDDRGRSALGSSLRSLAAEPREFAPAIVMVSVHAPYAEGKCNQCHDMSGGGIAEIAHDASLCDRCHLEQREQEGWDHGPINLGTCIPCHVPHQSQHAGLLAQPMTETCLACHVDVSPEADDQGAYHAVPNFNDCVACHDPHRMY